MSAPLRFLALALVGWVGVRAATLGYVPGSEIFAIRQSEAAPPPPIAATEFPPIEPLAAEMTPQPMAPTIQVPPGFTPAAVPFYYAAAAAPAPPPPPRPQKYTHILPISGPIFYSPIPQLDDWPLAQIASAPAPSRRSALGAPQQSAPAAAVKPRLDRLQLTAWALLRGKPGPDSLATGGTLGGSQAGARLTYHVTPWLAASLRTTSPVGGARGGEGAAGVRIAPFRTIPVALTAERRQAIGRFGGGRSAFALLLEGGVYQRPMPWKFQLDGYAQAGVVGVRSRDMFADGGLTLTRPLFGQFSAGLGVWGGVQPGIYRVDAGPRLSMRVRNSMRLHLDWRQRVVGNAQPGSGPALTLAGDF